MLGGSNLYITHLGNRQGTTRRQLHITQTQSDHRNTCSHYHKRANMSTFENGTLDTEFNGGVNTRTALWGETIWRTHTEMHSPFCTTILYYTTNLIYWLIDIYIFLCVCVCVCWCTRRKRCVCVCGCVCVCVCVCPTSLHSLTSLHSSCVLCLTPLPDTVIQSFSYFSCSVHYTSFFLF